MAITKEKNFGTKKISNEKLINVVIDGREINVPEGTSVMRAAIESGVDVPKLCASDNLDSFGSCRLCLVEIEGRKGYPSSCTTPVSEGMVVRTETPKLAKLRKGVMELYISDHPLDCLTCAANGDCELQDMAGVVGLRDVRYGQNGDNHLPPHGIENNFRYIPKDTSNPYFTYDPSKCIVCSRCVRACAEVQGTFALTISGRGFESRVSASDNLSFINSECVSCGACVQACPTATLMEKSVHEHGLAEHTVRTTCAYCGVGCSFNAEVKGQEVIRMVPSKKGKANEGHSCVKGRFAWGYAKHPDRILKPMIRKNITDPWEEVNWEVAISHTASEFKRIQNQYGKNAVGGITSSRCTNEETFLVQKFVRAALGTNNVDTCARVCHSPTGYGLKTTLGTSAGTQEFKSVEFSDVIVLIGANPTDAHPVFGSRLKKALRNGAQLIVIDPRKIDLVKTPHVKAAYHLPLSPGTNVAIINALSHVIIREDLYDEKYIKNRCDMETFAEWKEFILSEKNSPEELSQIAKVPVDDIIQAARLFAGAQNGSIYYGLGVTEHSQGSTMVMGMANLAMCTGNIGREGVGINPLRGQNNVQGSCDMGSFPHEFPGYRHVSDDAARMVFEQEWGVPLNNKPGLRIPNMIEEGIAGSFKGMYIQGEDVFHSDPNTSHIEAGFKGMECIVVQDLFLNETAKFAHIFLPGSTFLEKEGTFTNAERRINRVRKVMEPLNGMADWEITKALANAMGYSMNYSDPSEIMDEIARTTPTFKGVSYEKLERLNSIQWPCNDSVPNGTPTMHVDNFVIGKGRFMLTGYVPTLERSNKSFPLLMTTGRILSQYNVGTQTRRTGNAMWHDQDLLEIHPHDAETRGIKSGDRVSVKSRIGETTLKALISERMQPGVAYTTFHFPETQTNVVTTEHTDWATGCPEYKVTAIQVSLKVKISDWQKKHLENHSLQSSLAEAVT